MEIIESQMIWNEQMTEGESLSVHNMVQRYFRNQKLRLDF